MARLDGQVAIITGAASGMGKSTALLFAKEGAKVIVSDLNLEGAEAVAAEINNSNGIAMAIKTNVASEEDVEALVDKAVEAYGTVDILVNNAGIMDGFEPIGDIATDRFQKILSVNTNSVLFASRKVIPIFLDKGKGVIINNASVAGLYGGRGGAAYTASKHAVIGLTKNTAFMYAQKGIRANAIAPGAIQTNIASSMSNINEFGASRQGLGNSLIPKMGQPEEVAKLALFLASDDASYVNGVVVTADGGWSSY
ncbi:MAG: SDR family oxidoreductase [Bacillus sp. (in: firmicutes)]